MLTGGFYMSKKLVSLGIGLATIIMMVGIVSCTPAKEGAAATPQATSKLQEVLARGHLIVGTGSTNVPWHFKDDAGVLQGFDIEMGKILARGLFKDETKVQFVEQAPDARIPNLITDKVDITFQFMTISPLRSQQVAFTVPYYTEGIGLILPAKGKYKSYSEMVAAKKAGKEIVIAVLQNVDAKMIVNNAIQGARDDQYENQGLVYQAINSGRADAGMVDLSSVMWLASKEPEKYLDSGFSFNPQNYGGAMDPTDQVWINFVNQVLIDAMAGQNYKQYNDAYEKYFGVKLDAPRIGKPAMFR
jgi:polar amino acid transport system substrate-binding protein